MRFPIRLCDWNVHERRHREQDVVTTPWEQGLDAPTLAPSCPSVTVPMHQTPCTVPASVLIRVLPQVRRTDHSAEHMQHEAELHPDTVRSPNRGPKPFVSGNMSLCWVWLGLVLFAIGMRYGLNELGDRVGAVIPATFRKLPSLPGSPFYSHGVGVVLSFATAFIMGFGATLAEPALQAMAVTVEELTHDGLSVNQVCPAPHRSARTLMDSGPQPAH